MAMGNWGKTPTPPNDPQAPPAVGNEGELILDIAGDTRTYLVQSARLQNQRLEVEGEATAGSPDFILHLELPETTLPGDGAGLKELKGSTLALQSSSQVRDQAGDSMAIAEGKLTVLQVTGKGPWELDGQLEIRTADEVFKGTLKVRVRA